jgi:Sulfotransferase domain
MKTALKIFLLFFIFLNFASLSANQDLVTEDSELLVCKNALHKPFFVFCPPKCGTHLISKVISLITNETPNYNLGDMVSDSNAIKWVIDSTSQAKFAVAHNFNKPIVNSLVSKGYRVIFLVRDPRDQLISIMNWLKEGQWPGTKAAQITDHDKQITELITGKKYGFRSFDSYFLKYEKCLVNIPSNNVYYAHFESLVGPLGGGSLDKQKKEIMGLAKFLKISINPDHVENIANQIFGNSETFRQGQIGSWKAHFNETHKALFKKSYKKHLIRLGYEKDSKW